jgi:hypothetical protein
MSKGIRLVSGGSGDGTGGSAWPQEAGMRALFDRIAALRPDGITVLCEGAHIEGGKVWLALSEPNLAGVTIGHARVLRGLAEDLLPADAE